MPQTTINRRQPAWLGEGQYATTAERRVEGAIQRVLNGVAGILPYGRVIIRNNAGRALLPSAAAVAVPTATAGPILGVSIMKEGWGVPLNTALRQPTPAEIQSGTVIPEGQIGYPQGDVMVEFINQGDVIMVTEESITDADVLSTGVFYRYAGGTAPNNVPGRVRKSAVASEAEALPNAKFVSTAPAGGLVIVRLSTTAGATALY